MFAADFRLPFKLPIEDGIKFVSAFPFADFRATFSTIEVDLEIANMIGDYWVITNIKLECLYKDEEQFRNDKPNGVRNFVMTSIEYINRFLDALRMAHKMSYIRNITIADLPLYLIINWDGDETLYLTRPEYLLEIGKELNTIDFIKIGNLMEQKDKYTKMILVDNFFESAKTYISREQFSHAVIELQTSFEIFIRESYRLVLIKKKCMETDIARLSDTAFRNVVEQNLSKELQTDLSFTKPGVIHEWYKKVYQKRNDIVHRGMIYISGNEADEALQAYINARNYVADLLIEKGYLGKEGDFNLEELYGKRAAIDHATVHEHLRKIGFLPMDGVINLVS